ncbi:MAG: hypothetical protein MI861_10385 [Pirellulales bacterium]|nr:hypothetical protein [Pirellulales bacterium]
MNRGETRCCEERASASFNVETAMEHAHSEGRYHPTLGQRRRDFGEHFSSQAITFHQPRMNRQPMDYQRPSMAGNEMP